MLLSCEWHSNNDDDADDVDSSISFFFEKSGIKDGVLLLLPFAMLPFDKKFSPNYACSSASFTHSLLVVLLIIVSMLFFSVGDKNIENNYIFILIAIIDNSFYLMLNMQCMI